MTFLLQFTFTIPTDPTLSLLEIVYFWYIASLLETLRYECSAILIFNIQTQVLQRFLYFSPNIYSFQPLFVQNATGAVFFLATRGYWT